MRELRTNSHRTKTQDKSPKRFEPCGEADSTTTAQQSSSPRKEEPKGPFPFCFFLFFSDQSRKRSQYRRTQKSNGSYTHINIQCALPSPVMTPTRGLGLRKVRESHGSGRVRSGSFQIIADEVGSPFPGLTRECFFYPRPLNAPPPSRKGCVHWSND